ncbi:UDP-N-acetylmuramate dehydrogenase [Lutimonas sp.]|uniref:UDP-N-acetylmuramate dehydrogenase n=1 Tax=Lutimonas sp. TaxID=1872403 RepID=UPI003D9AB73C
MFQKNVSLRALNTFGIDALAEKFAEVNSVSELSTIIEAQKDVFILSGGSNILLTKNIEKPVVFLNIKGIDIIERNDSHVLVKAQAGENWHEFVCWCLSHDFGGLENLSLIPGNVGTSPMQNIGAYGVEIKDCFENLEALEISTGRIKQFTAKECAFGYRESVFKNDLKGKYIILNVTFKLSTSSHQIKADYGAIKDQLASDGVLSPSIQDISKAVIAIRKSKLPDPKEIGNSGSFFKNPVISATHFSKIKAAHPEVPYYTVTEDAIKVPAGWLVEKCGFKGKRFGDAGVHKKQALVLVNYNRAKGADILDLAKNIQTEVSRQFEIDLDMEVNII